MSRSRRKPAGPPADEHMDERWAVPYGDMLTVLMCLFIVLFAMSDVNVQKFEKLKASLATGFGVESSETVDTAEGVIVPPEQVGKDGALTDLELAQQEVDKLQELEDAVANELAAKGLSDTVRFVTDERGLTVRMMSSETFFNPNVATLTDEAVNVLSSVAPVLSGSDRQIGVEGHTQAIPYTYPYLTGWELSTARSVNVVRYLVENGAVKPEKITPSGFGESRPLTPGTTEDEKKLNRRTDIVIASDQPDRVKALIPEAAAKDKAEEAAAASH